jgi:hypothetical protein
MLLVVMKWRRMWRVEGVEDRISGKKVLAGRPEENNQWKA